MSHTTRDNLGKLITRTALKDRRAFDALYDATSAKLFGVCLRILNDPVDAEDALQDIYIKIWTKADRFSISELSPISWLVAIARNHAIDVIRARNSSSADFDEANSIVDSAPTPEMNAVRSSDMAKIEWCLDQLHVDRADAVRSAYLNGDSYADLAARHNVPLNTMRTWLRRSLINLRACLER